MPAPASTRDPTQRYGAVEAVRGRIELQVTPASPESAFLQLTAARTAPKTPSP